MPDSEHTYPGAAQGKDEARERLGRIADACVNGEFDRATDLVKSFRRAVTAEDIVSVPAAVTAIAVAGAFGGPYSFVEQLPLLFDNADIRQARRAPECERPIHIVDHLFDTALDAALDAIEAKRWAKTDAAIALSVGLPAASEVRAAALKRLAAELLARWRMVEAEIIATSGDHRRPLHASEWGVLRINVSLPLAASESAGYPELAREVLTDIIATADWPTFSAIDPAWVAVLWPALLEIHERRDSIPLSVCAREWLSGLIAKPGIR